MYLASREFGVRCGSSFSRASKAEPLRRATPGSAMLHRFWEAPQSGHLNSPEIGNVLEPRPTKPWSRQHLLSAICHGRVAVRLVLTNASSTNPAPTASPSA